MFMLQPSSHPTFITVTLRDRPLQSCIIDSQCIIHSVDVPMHVYVTLLCHSIVSWCTEGGYRGEGGRVRPTG